MLWTICVVHDSAVAVRYSYFIYDGRFYPYSARNCHYSAAGTHHSRTEDPVGRGIIFPDLAAKLFSCLVHSLMRCLRGQSLLLLKLLTHRVFKFLVVQ